MKLYNKTVTSLLVAFTLLSACKKDGLERYNQESSGSSVYFPEAVGATASIAIAKTISFGYVGYTKKDSILAIPVAVTGDTMQVDRPLKVSLGAGTTAVEGTHYTFLRTPVIRAGKVTDTIYVKVNRTTDMTTTQFALNLQLEQNEYFSTKLRDTAANYLTYKLLLDDIAGTSYLWVSFSNTRGIISYFGDYSRRKVDLMIEVLGVDAALFYDPAYGSFFGTARVLAYGRYMALWLTQEANAGRIYLDEKGQRITMGALAG